MYNFVDTTERYQGQNLPSEALMFNGSYLENVIPGYRTLYVSGREILGTEITDLETGVSDGTKYRRKRYQPIWMQNIRMFQSSIATSTTVESIVPIKRISMMLLTNSRTTSGMSMISILQIWKQRNRWSSTEERFC